MREPTHTKATTIGGTLTAFFININGQDMARTIVLTAIGAAVSFATSLVLKQMLKWWKSRGG